MLDTVIFVFLQWSKSPLSMEPMELAQGPILQNSISAENFSDKFASSNFGQRSSQKQSV
jgi:hypothetical protein